MLAMTIVKWTTKEIKEELQVLIQPEALLKTGRRYGSWSEQLVNFGLRRVSFLAVCRPQDIEKLHWAASKIEKFNGIHQVVVRRMRRLDYYYFRIYIKPEYFQKAR